jgi:hypothetical protein
MISGKIGASNISFLKVFPRFEGLTEDLIWVTQSPYM